MATLFYFQNGINFDRISFIDMILLPILTTLFVGKFFIALLSHLMRNRVKAKNLGYSKPFSSLDLPTYTVHVGLVSVFKPIYPLILGG